MKCLPRLLALLALLCSSVAARPALAETEPVANSFERGTHAFRRILFDLKLQPVKSVAEIDDPAHTVVVLLGETDMLNDLPGGLQGFLDRGGAVLVATDRKMAPGPASQLARFGVRVTGEPVQFGLLNIQLPGEEPANRPIDLTKAYRGESECPFVLPAPRGPGAALFRSLPGPGGKRLSLQRVATNRPSRLLRDPRSRLPVLAVYPDGSLYAGNSLSPSPLVFGAGGPVGRGRLLVLADHSVFINEMLLQSDNDNIDFTYNCVDWLTEGPEPRDRVLFVEEGVVRRSFDIPLKDVPVDLPPPEAVVPMIDNALAGLEKDDAFNRIVLGDDPEEQSAYVERLVTFLLLGLTGLLAVYGLYRLWRARHGFDLSAPVLERILARQPRSRNVTEERHHALLGQGNLWEPARSLARQCFAAVGGPPEDHAPASVRPAPRIEVSGGWWRRWSLSRRVRRLWQLAYGAVPVPVSLREFARLAAEIRAIQGALAAGALRLDFSGGTSRAPIHGRGQANAKGHPA